MAKVPQYVQDSIASQLVGSPGVDTSAQTISAANAERTATLLSDEAQRTSGFIAGVGTAIGSVVQSFGYELRYAQHQKQQREEAQQQVLNALEAKRHMRNIERQLDDARVTYSENRKGNPFGMALDYEEAQNKFVKEYMRENGLTENAKDRNKAAVALQVMGKTEERLATQFGLVRGDEKTLTTNNLITNFKSTVSHMTTRRTNGDINALQSKLDEFENMREEGIAYLGADADKYMGDAEQKAIRSHFYEVMQNQPGLAEAQLNAILSKKTEDGKTGVKELLDPEEEKKIRNDIKSWRNTIQNEAEAAVRTQDHISQMDIMETVLAANVDPEDPAYERKTKIARAQLESLKHAESKKLNPFTAAPEDLKANPGAYKSLSVEKMLNSQLNSMDSQAKQIKSAKEHAAAVGRQAAAQEETNRRNRAMDVYNSGPNQQRRADLESTVKQLREFSNAKKVPPMGLLAQAREQVHDLQMSGGMDLYGRKQDEAAKHIGLIKEMTTRALQGEGRPSIFESIMQAKAKPAPADLQRQYNIGNDPIKGDRLNRAYQKELEQNINEYIEANEGRKPTEAQLKNLETLTTQKLLFLGQIEDATD